MRCEGSRVWLRFNPAQLPVATLIGAVAAQYAVSDLTIEEPDLEGVVRQIYEGRPAEPPAVLEEPPSAMTTGTT